MRYWTNAHFIESCSSGIRSTIRFASRLHPDNGVDVSVIKNRLISSWADSEACTSNVTPLAPFCTNGPLSSSSLVDDEVGRVAGGFEVGSQRIDVMIFVPAIRPLGEIFADSGDILVVVGDVNSETTSFRAGVDLFGVPEDLGEHCGRWSQIIVPSKPAAMSCIEIKGDVGLL